MGWHQTDCRSEKGVRLAGQGRASRSAPIAMAALAGLVADAPGIAHATIPVAAVPGFLVLLAILALVIWLCR